MAKICEFSDITQLFEHVTKIYHVEKYHFWGSIRND